jgi:hypothetical protein
MSHFTTIKTELRNLDMIQAALRRLGYEFEIGGTVPDFFKRARKVDLVVHIPGQRAVGFSANPSTGIIALVGDWYGSAMKEQEFLSALKGNYAREQVLDSLGRQGVDLSKVKETETPDGSVVFELPLESEEMDALLAGQ